MELYFIKFYEKTLYCLFALKKVDTGLCVTARPMPMAANDYFDSCRMTSIENAIHSVH